jgi:hypothetical protein
MQFCVAWSSGKYLVSSAVRHFIPHGPDIETDTEIDWVAYMQQVDIYLKGERNYYNIKGDTGPLVYPGLHVYIYRLLYALTGNGKNIVIGQIIFASLYLSTLVVVISCYRRAKVGRSSNVLLGYH